MIGVNRGVSSLGEILGSKGWAVLGEQLQFHVKAQENPFRSPAVVHVGRVVTC